LILKNKELSFIFFGFLLFSFIFVERRFSSFYFS